MEYFVTLIASDQHPTYISRIRLYRLGSCSLEFECELSRQQAVSYLKSGDEFLTAYVHQNLFVRIAPLRVMLVNGQELLSIEGMKSPYDPYIRLPEGWLLPG